MSSDNINTSKTEENAASLESESDSEPYPDFTQIPVVRFVFISAYLLVMVLAVVGNAVICCTVFTNRKMHTAVNYYIVNLAICDFMVGIFVLPLKLLELTSPAHWGILNDTLCTAMMYLQTIFVFASVLTLVAICMERYMAVLHPLESRMHQTKARAKKILCLVWIIPCCLASPFLYPSEAFANTLQSEFGEISRLTCFIGLPEKVRRVYYTFLFVFVYIFPLIFIAGTCFKVARCLLQGIPVHRQGSIRRQEANRRKIAKMVLMVILAFVVSWTPYFLVSIITEYQEVNFMHHENFFFTMLCINLFAFINSCVNPFIYAAMSTRFRNGFRRCFRVICLVELFTKNETIETSFDPNTVNRNRSTKTVRFMCQPPMSCLITQSSSDYGSGGSGARMSEVSQRTACTIDVSNKRNGSFFHNFLKRKTSNKLIVHYIKSEPEFNSSPQINKGNSSALKSIDLTLPNLISNGRHKLNRKNSCSTGDVSLIDGSCSEELHTENRKCMSCLDILNNQREGQFF